MGFPQPTNDRRRIAVLILVMTGAAFATAVAAITILYQAAVRDKRIMLEYAVKSEASLIDAVAGFDSVHSRKAHPKGWQAATLSQVSQAHNNWPGFGHTGEFVVAQRNGDQVEFLLKQRLWHMEKPDPMPFASLPDTPLKWALEGQSGSRIARDYREVKVLAAYEPLKTLNAALVAKVDMAEVRSPFLRAGLASLLAALGFVALAAWLFVRLNFPLIQRLEESTGLNRLILEAALDSLVVMDHRGRIVEFSEAAKAMTGYDRRQALGQPLASMLFPSDLKAAGLPGPGAETAQGESLELEARRADGEAFQVDLVISRLKKSDPPLYVLFLRYITEKKRTEAHHQQSQRLEALGKLSGGVAHDFNNHLGLILGYCEDLLAKTPKDDPRRGALVEISKAGERSKKLTHQLLAFSRGQVMEPRVVDLNRILADLQAMVQRLLGEKVSLTLQPLEGLWPIKVDPVQMEQVVMNLAVNARDAMPKGGRLLLSTDNITLGQGDLPQYRDLPEGDYVVLTATDTGTGISKEVQERLFEPFFTTKEKGKGTGLGLSMIHGIVRQSGGQIWVYSEPGAGTAFKLYFPATHEALAPEQAPSPAEPKEEVEGSETILLVDDEQSLRRMIAMVLTEKGYRVLEAPNGEAALELFEKKGKEVSLVVTDMVMSGMDGLQLVKSIREKTPGMKAILCSGYTEGMQVSQQDLGPGTLFLEKPVPLAKLEETLRRLLDA